MNDALGDRMKNYYENRTRHFLARRTYTIIRIDGKAFHTYTVGLDVPFDEGLIISMNETAKYLCASIQGAKLAFVQSDEISILLTDFDQLTTDAWFDGNIQKIVSVSASLATAKFNFLRLNKIALFDSRVFQIPSNVEVENYFIWRQQDATRNSIQAVAQSLYSHRELEGKNTNEQQEMIFQKGINWNDFPIGQKRGRLIVKTQDQERTRWTVYEPLPIFTQEREFLTAQVPIAYSNIELLSKIPSR